MPMASSQELNLNLNTTEGAKWILKTWFGHGAQHPLQQILQIGPAQFTGLRGKLEDLILKLSLRLDKDLRGAWISTHPNYSEFDVWYANKFKECSEKSQIKHCQSIFLLHAIIHIQDALHSLLPDDTNDTTFVDLITRISPNIQTDLQKLGYEDRPQRKVKGLRQHSAQAGVLRKEYLQEYDRLVPLIERSAMWRSQATEIYNATMTADNSQYTVPRDDCTLRELFVAASKKVATSQLELNLISLACGIRWGCTGENMMRDEDHRMENMDKNEAMSLDVAASIDINCLVTQMGDDRKLQVGELLNYLELPRRPVTDMAHKWMSRILWFGVACMSQDAVSIKNVLDAWLAAYKSFGFLEEPNTPPRPPRGLRFTLSDVNVSSDDVAREIFLVDPTSTSWRAVYGLLPDRKGKRKIADAPPPPPSDSLDSPMPQDSRDSTPSSVPTPKKRQLHLPKKRGFIYSTEENEFSEESAEESTAMEKLVKEIAQEMQARSDKTHRRSQMVVNTSRPSMSAPHLPLRKSIKGKEPEVSPSPDPSEPDQPPLERAITRESYQILIKTNSGTKTVDIPWSQEAMKPLAGPLQYSAVHHEPNVLPGIILFDRSDEPEEWPENRWSCFLHESTISAHPDRNFLDPTTLEPWVNPYIPREVRDQSILGSPDESNEGVHRSASLIELAARTGEWIAKASDIGLGDWVSVIDKPKFVDLLLTDMLTAWSGTSNDEWCIKDIPSDVLLWMRYEQAGVINRFRIEGHGLGTWTEVLDGEKCVSMVGVPFLKCIDFSLLRPVEDMDLTFSSRHKTTMRLLQPGSVLTMPPGTVSSSVNSRHCVTIGGNFYSGHQFDLTSMARLTEHYYGSLCTDGANSHAELFLHRMMIYAGKLIMDLPSCEDGVSHQHIVNSPYPLYSLAALVHMCQHPTLFGFKQGAEGISAEFAGQRQEAKRIAIQLELFAKEKATQNQGKAWVCLKQRILDAHTIDAVRRRIEEESLGRRRSLFKNNSNIIRPLGLLIDAEKMKCGGKGPCRPSPMSGILRGIADMGLALDEQGSIVRKR